MKEKTLSFINKNLKLTKNNTFNNVYIIKFSLSISFYQLKIFSTNLLLPVIKIKFSVTEIVK